MEDTEEDRELKRRRMQFPEDYLERVYAGVLGKVIGVYMGRPFEGWTHQRIMKELGHVRYYVNERLGVPIVVTDDDNDDNDNDNDSDMQRTDSSPSAHPSRAYSTGSSSDTDPNSEPPPLNPKKRKRRSDSSD